MRATYEQTRIMRLPEVIRVTGLSRSVIYDRVKHRSFPSQIDLGGRAVGWSQAEVEEWLQTRINLRGK